MTATEEEFDSRPCANELQAEHWTALDQRSRLRNKDGNETEMAKSLKAACAACPLMVECQEMALKMERNAPLSHRHGIYGALDPWERQQLADARGEHKGAGGVWGFSDIVCANNHDRDLYSRVSESGKVFCGACADLRLDKVRAPRTSKEFKMDQEHKTFIAELNKWAERSTEGWRQSKYHRGNKEAMRTLIRPTAPENRMVR